MMATIGLEAFCAAVNLPDGLYFKEWAPGCFLTPKVDKEGSYYYSAFMMAIVRASDHAGVAFEVSGLKQHGTVEVSVSKISQAVDEAIAQLTGETVNA